MGDCIPQTPCEGRCERAGALELPISFPVLSIAKEQKAPGWQAPISFHQYPKSKGFRARKAAMLRVRKYLLQLVARVQKNTRHWLDSRAKTVN